MAAERTGDETAEDKDPPWPLWRRQAADSVAQLARYVSDVNIAGLDLSTPEAHQLRFTAAGTDERQRRRQGNRQVADRLYRRLSDKRYQYTDDPVLVVDEAQRIRDPHELDAFAGTCLDVATAFASMCLEAKVAPLLVVGTRPMAAPDGPGHAWVILDLERDPNELTAHEGAFPGLPQGDQGVVFALPEDRASALIYNERFLPIDPTCALQGFTHGGDLDVARARGRQLLCDEYRDVFAVDVLATHSTGLIPHALPAPSMRPVISRHLPTAPSYVSYGEDRDRALARIARARGSVVVVGDPGMGKSMLALQAAAHADGGFGWLVGANNERTLIRSLAIAEAQQVGRPLDELGKSDYDDLASSALVRLRESEVPWVVVVDNADCSPHDLAKWLPTPKEQARQLLIITTTNPAWMTFAPDPIILGPVDAVRLGCPDKLKVNGRPLFANAFGELAATLETSVQQLAELPELAELDGDAEHLLWAIVRKRLPADVHAATVAAWLPADDVDLDIVRQLTGHPDPSSSLRFLLSPSSPGRARMHRLVSAAIRRQRIDADPDATLRVLAEVLDSPADLDVDALQEIEAHVQTGGALRANTTDSHLNGRVLHGVGVRLEPLVGVEPAAPLMRDALSFLAAEDLQRRADCLHAAGRYAFQHRKSDLGALDSGRKSAEEAIELRLAALAVAPEDSQLKVERWRSVALLGLLEVQRAITSLKGVLTEEQRATENQLALTGNARIDQALRERRGLISDPDDLDLLRGRFNQAFSAVNLAQLPGAGDPETWLDIAFQHYKTVGDARRVHRSKPMAQVAACDAGLALTQYLRATLLPGVDRSKRVELLREASVHLERGLRIRESFEPRGGSETLKTVKLEVKIAFARMLLCHRGTPADAIGEVLGQLWSEPRDLVDGCAPLGPVPAAQLADRLAEMWLAGPGFDASDGIREVPPSHGL